MLLALPARIPAQMALVPLYDETAAPDASHHVRAPGGYESWRTISYDAKRDLLLYGAVHEGCQSDPLYHKALHRYLRDPTRRPPPLPRDYCCEELAVYHRGQRVAYSFNRIPPPGIPISGAQQIQVGHCIIDLQPLPPRSSLDQSTFNSSHHWLLRDPLATLRGQLDLESAHFTFEGIPACRDHRFGPALPPLRQLIDGIVFFPDSAIFFLATPTTSWIVRASRDGIELLDQPLTMMSPPAERFRFSYPLEIVLGDAVALKNPSVIDRSLTRMRLLFTSPADESIHAFCEISYPGRFTWPLFNLIAPRPSRGQPILTCSPPLPADKSSPSDPARARAPSSSP
jgi:hypothetical protein